MMMMTAANSKTKESNPSFYVSPGILVLYLWELESGGSEVQSHPKLYSEFESSPGYMRPYVKKGGGKKMFS